MCQGVLCVATIRVRHRPCLISGIFAPTLAGAEGEFFFEWAQGFECVLRILCESRGCVCVCVRVLFGFDSSPSCLLRISIKSEAIDVK